MSHSYCGPRQAVRSAAPPKEKRLRLWGDPATSATTAGAGAGLLAQEGGSRRKGMWKMPERSPEAVADFPKISTHKYGITRYRVTLHVHECAPAAVPPPPDGTLEQYHAPTEIAALPMPSPIRRALDQQIMNH